MHVSASTHRILGVGAALWLGIALAGAAPGIAAAAKYQPLRPQEERNVRGTAVAPLAAPADPAAAAALTGPLPAPVWPAAAVAEADLSPTLDPRSQARGPVRPGRLPVLLDRPVSTRAGAATVPATVRAEVLDRAHVPTAYHNGVVLRLGRTDAVTAPGLVRLTVDYNGFRSAYGADWAARLRLVVLPECALSTPDALGCRGTPLRATNDVRGGVISADTPVAASASAGTLVAVTSGPAGNTGDFSATSLAASSTWAAGGSTGDFSWSYPLRMPPSLGGPVPSVALAYSASSVDGRNAASNNQPSWIGEGFEFWPGFVERRYKACADDMGGDANNTTKTGDLCWGTDNATLSFNGQGGELIKDSTTGVWRLRSDDGSRIERLTGASNGDDNGEYWKVTTADGTQYFFGLNRITGWTSGRPVAQSTWTVPVFGNNAGEPCRQANFAASYCDQAWRWNLDYVVDTNGNTMSYWYEPETTHYARNLTDTSVSSLIRGGTLTRIDYGTRQSAEFGTVPMRVVFGSAERCVPGTTCTRTDPTHYPDTPWDLDCTSTTSCPGKYSPTFWTQKRLSTVTTQVWGGSGYRDVETWTLTHSYPDPGDGTRAGLWLASIAHTGKVGGTLSLPDVTFTGVQMANRVDTLDHSPPMNWWRIAAVNTETGGIISVVYSGVDCIAGSRMPTAPESNTLRCFPVMWTPEGYSSPIRDWYHKYLVMTVIETDLVGGNPRMVTSYEYLGSPAWHYDDDDGLVAPSRKTYAQFRGYEKVRVRKGDPGEQQMTQVQYFRGMHGDRLPTGTRSVQIVDSQGGSVNDEDAYSGMVRETITYNGTAEVVGQISDPWQSAPTATRTANGVTTYARVINTAGSHTRITRDGGRAVQRAETVTTFDSYGLPTQVHDRGDPDTTTDDQCRKTTYVRNTARWILATAARVETYALPCGQQPASADDVVSDVLSSFDSQEYGVAPTAGDVTKVEAIKEWSASGSTYVTTARSTFDAYGREIESVDVSGNHTTTAYTPPTGGPVTALTNTNALGWVATTELEPAWGAVTAEVDVNGKRTDAEYDPLGRLISVWYPGRLKGSQTPSTRYAYLVRKDGANAVTTSHLNPAGNYLTTYELFDGLMRERQTQEPAVGGGRVLTDTYYDTAGEMTKANGEYYNTDAPGTTLFNPQDNDIASQTLYRYDAAGRVTTGIFRSLGDEKWRTTTSYGGDHTDVTPPPGATATSRYNDVQGRVTELRQFRDPSPTGAYDATTYGYDRKGRMSTVTDAAGSRWTYTYDLRGRVVTTADPDQGTSTYTYDDADEVLTATDSRGRTLAYEYDTLGRVTALHDGSITGPRRAEWTYDTLAKGRLTSATRWVNGNAYVIAARGYTDRYQATGTTITIPASEGTLAGSYQFQATYKLDGTLATMRLPAAGGLPAETLTLGYEATLGLPTTLASNIPGTTGYVSNTEYTRFGERAVTTLSTGAKIAQTGRYYEESTRRLSRIVATRETAPSTIADLNYTYNEAGLVTKIADTPAGGTADTQCFSHDYLGRTTQAWTPASGACSTDPTNDSLGGPVPYWHSWTFDVTGNRRSQVEHATATGDVTTTYTYPAAGGAQPHTLTGTRRTDNTGERLSSYSYDPAGNTLTRPGATGAQTLTWDPEGHLAALTEGSATTSYIYDPAGNRLLSRDATGTTLYLGAMELRLTASTGAVTATRYYIHQGEVVATRTAAGVKWLVGDRQGTAQIAIDAASQSVTQRRFTPYGSTRGSTAGWPTDKGFVGGTTDATGLIHLGAREYDPLTGRFLSVDPVLDTDNPQQLHGYLYSNNAPETLSDPDGLCWGPDWLCKKAKQAWNWTTSKVSSAWDWTTSKVSSGWGWVEDRFAQARHWVSDKLAQARHWVSDKFTKVRHWVSDKFAKTRHWVSDKLAKTRHWASDKFAKARHWIAVHGPNALERGWHVLRFVSNLPATAIGIVYGLSTGASCSWYRGLMVTCTGAKRWARDGGITIGNVYTTTADKKDLTPELMEHETRHATQYSWYVWNPLGYFGAYLTASGVSWGIYQVAGPRTDSQGRKCTTASACYNIFEIDADLHKGGYYQ